MAARRMTWGPSKRQPISDPVRRQLADRLLRHVNERWKGRVRKILLRFHGRYAYVAAVEAERGEQVLPRVCRHVDAGEVPTELCRLGYLGSIDRWEYAFFKYSDEKYAPSISASGSFVATPEQAFDTSAIYLQG